MEPLFMALGESAAIAADMLMNDSESVQEIDYPTLAERIQSVGQIIHYEEPSS